MRIISSRKDATDGIGVMTDGIKFVSLAAANPDLPTTMMGLLGKDDGIVAAETAAKGKDADLSLNEVQLLPLIPDTPVIWCAGVNYKDHADETGRGQKDEPMLFI